MLDPIKVHRTITHHIMPALVKEADPDTGLWTGSMSVKLEALVKNRPGSHVMYLSLLQRLRLIVLSHGAVTGRAAKDSPRSTLWTVYAKRTVSQRDVLEAMEAHREHARQVREQARKEARLAGEHGEQAEGGPVRTRHEHANVLTHRHASLVERAHYHTAPYDGETTGGVTFVEMRHHTHEAKPVDPEATTNGVVTQEVRSDLAGGRQAVLERARVRLEAKPGETASDGRHRRLMNYAIGLEEQLREAALRISTLEGQKAALEELLDRATDPTEDTAEEFLKERGQ